MSDLKKAKICYGCGEKWEPVEQYSHLCSMCRYDYDIPDIDLTKHGDCKNG